MIDIDDELAKDSLAAYQEHLAIIETELIAMETGGAKADEGRVKRASEAVYAIKVNAGVLEHAKIGELAWKVEEALGRIRSGDMVATPDRMGVLLRATDKLRELLQDLGASNQADIAEIMAALAGLGKSRLSPAGRVRQGGGRLRTLLVEDDFASRLLLQTFLSRYGECHVAVNGREAVEAFRAALEGGQKYDLICMDIMMAEMDGREAVRQVRAMEAAHGILSTGAKIIMTTAVHEIKEVIRCYEELCDSYLLKPIDLGKLLSLMKSYQMV